MLLFSLAGCFPSLDGLTGGDASISDAPSSDASDAAIEAPAEASGPFCPQQNTVVCSDFDEADGGGFASQWGYVYAPGTATVQESTAFFKSPPRSLLVATTGTDYSAIVRKDVGYTNGVTLELDMRLVAFGGNCGIAGFSTGAGGLTLTPRDTGTNISEAITLADGGTSYDGTTSTPVIPTNTWVHVIYDLDRAKNKLTVTLDGTVIIAYTPANTAWATTTSATVYIGPGDASNETVYYDDVTIRTR